MAVGLATAGIAAVCPARAGFRWAPRARVAPAHRPAPPHTLGASRAWQEEAARAQALVGRETLEVGIDIQTNPDLVAYQLAQMIGHDLELPDLDAHGFRFVRAQLLRCERRALGATPLSRRERRTARALRQAGEGSDPPAVQALWRDRRRDVVAGGVAYLLAATPRSERFTAEARRGDRRCGEAAGAERQALR